MTAVNKVGSTNILLNNPMLTENEGIPRRRFTNTFLTARVCFRCTVRYASDFFVKQTRFVYLFICCYFCLQLETHFRDHCPKTEVQCEFKNLGCEAVVWNLFFNVVRI